MNWKKTIGNENFLLGLGLFIALVGILLDKTMVAVVALILISFWAIQIIRGK